MNLTSESVTPGHPDKVCDQISDAILDEYLRQDPHARVAVETLASASSIVLAGEVKSSAEVNHLAVARDVIRSIGYTAENGLDAGAVEMQDQVVSQSEEISAAVDNSRELGAGDQGMMFGYATDETPELMPAPLMLARAITDRLVLCRENLALPWLRPDGKAQVTVRYEDGRPVWVDAVVISTQHAPDVPLATVQEGVRQSVLAPVLEASGLRLHMGTKLYLNPAGPWSIGGPASDAGLTGRKIIVDTYGGAARHGGGAFSGKDPSKVDRSAAYAARQAAKYLVEAGAAEKAEVQLSYAIGVAEPVSVRVDTFGGGAESDERLAGIIRDRFDFTPQGIIDRLDLTKPRYRDTAARGHFGRANLPWEDVR